jgi:hypothetical protein
MGSNKDPIQTDDPVIVEKLVKTEEGEAQSTNSDSEDQEIEEITFELENGTEVTVSEGDQFISDTGCVVGKIDRIRCSLSDIVSIGEVTHWVYIDYGEGNDSETQSIGGCPLGEVAKQMNEGSMTTLE